MSAQERRKILPRAQPASDGDAPPKPERDELPQPTAKQKAAYEAAQQGEQAAKGTWSIIGGLAVLAVFILLGLWMCSDGKGGGGKWESLSHADRLQRMEAEHFTTWDGSQRFVVEAVKARMHDPSTYSHVDTKWVRPQEGAKVYKVITTFRGRNALGATVLNEVTVICNFQTGKVVRVE